MKKFAQTLPMLHKTQMIFRQLFSADTSTFTYILGCEETGKGVIVDPVLEEVERDAKLLKELGLTVTHILDTHVHAGECFQICVKMF